MIKKNMTGINLCEFNLCKRIIFKIKCLKYDAYNLKAVKIHSYH